MGLVEPALAFVDPRNFDQGNGNATGLFLLSESRQGKLIVRQRFEKMMLMVVDFPDSK